jgi:hypothetical protein
MFDIAIISCNRTYNRIHSLFDSLHPLTQSGAARSIYMILQSDVGSFDNEVFDSSLWAEHIDQIAHILALNIRDCNGLRSAPLLKTIDLSRDTFFQSRLLKDAEKSLLCKHYNALKLARDLPILVLEDDAEYNKNFYSDLCEAARISLEENFFVDLGTMGKMTSRGRFVSHKGFSYSMQMIGCTRTTVASIWSPLIAQKLVDAYWPCALPADLHHQYLLTSLRVPGIWPSSVIFNHLSNPMSGQYDSAIQGCSHE